MPAGIYTLTRSGSDDTNDNGDLDITDALTLIGAGASTTTLWQTVASERVLHVPNTSAVALEGITVRGGNLISENGGGARFGGAATLTETTFTSNTSSSGGGGGAIFWGAATLTGTTFISNTANTQGGGAYFSTAYARQLVNVLFAGNRAAIEGAAIFVNGATPLQLIHVTIVSPTTPTGASQAVFVQAGTVFITNTLIASHTVGIERVGGTVNAAFTLFSDVGTPTSGTVTNTNAVAGPAAFFNHTAYTLTQASLAVDAGTNAGLTSDFFGNARPQGNGFDIGYAESPFVVQLLRLFLPLIQR